jgi:hypothetical protein
MLIIYFILKNNKKKDWNCQCGAHNYASRAECFKCNISKLEGESKNRSGHSFKSGDWNCPSC